MKGLYIRNSIIGIICKDVEKKRYNWVTGKRKENISEKRNFHLIGNITDAIELLCFLYPD